MPLKKGSSQKTISRNIGELVGTYKEKGRIGASKPKSRGAAVKQAAAIAYSVQRGAKKMKDGGDPRLSVSRGEKLPTSQGAGLTEKGRQKFNRATGANLKAPAPHPKTKADAGRKASFCARMSGMPGPKRDEKGELTRKAASLKRWNCPGW